MHVSALFRSALYTLLMLSCGCATVPRHLVDPVAYPHVDCDPQNHFWAIGTDPTSREKAVETARSNVAAQVSSQIDAIVESRNTVIVTSDQKTTRKATQQSRAMRQRSSFSHAELMKLIPPVVRSDGVYRALVCLNRADAANAVRSSIEVRFARAQRDLKEALQAAAVSDRRKFVAAWQEALRAAPELQESMAQLRALRGTAAPDELEYQSDLRKLSEASAQMRATTRVFILFEANTLPEELQSKVPQALRDALLGLGLQGSVTTKDPCASERDDIVLRIVPQQSCRWGRLGHTCRLLLPTDVESCAQTNRLVGQGDLAEKLVANHPRNERFAIMRLQNEVDARIQKPLFNLLSPELPINVSSQPPKE